MRRGVACASALGIGATSAWRRGRTDMSNALQPGFGRAAKLFQAEPSLAKLIQAKLLGLAWFYSSNSGLINGLRRNPNKNFSPRSLLASRLSPERMTSLRRLRQTRLPFLTFAKIVLKVRLFKCQAAPVLGQFEFRLPTYCGRSRPCSWSPQLGDSGPTGVAKERPLSGALLPLQATVRRLTHP